MGQSIGHVLVVEDDLLLNNMFTNMVADMGFAVTTTDNADDARRALCEGNFRFVVTDLSLHGDRQSGMILAHDIIQRRSGARVVIVSGHPRPSGLNPCICFLQKPFTVAQLQGALEMSIH
ncbi:MAG: response regulator [Sphingomonadales bacterium]|nr:MAG: response regulator [Sphingomonadales bacterium]